MREVSQKQAEAQAIAGKACPGLGAGGAGKATFWQFPFSLFQHRRSVFLFG